MSKRSKALRKAQWYRMVEFFDGPAQAVTNVNDADVLLQGVIYEAEFPCPHCNHKVKMDRIKLREDGRADLSPQLGLCLIPQEAVSNQQGEALRRMLEANLRMPVLLISNNVQMVRLKPVTQAEADRILEEGKDGESAEGKLVAFPGSDREEEQGGGQGARAAGGDGPPADPGAGAPPADGGSSSDAQDPAGADQGGGEGDPVGVDQDPTPAPEAEPDPAR